MEKKSLEIFEKIAKEGRKAQKRNNRFLDRWYDGEQTVFDIGGAALKLIRQARGEI